MAPRLALAPLGPLCLLLAIMRTVTEAQTSSSCASQPGWLSLDSQQGSSADGNLAELSLLQKAASQHLNRQQKQKNEQEAREVEVAMSANNHKIDVKPKHSMTLQVVKDSNNVTDSAALAREAAQVHSDGQSANATQKEAVRPRLSLQIAPESANSTEKVRLVEETAHAHVNLTAHTGTQAEIQFVAEELTRDKLVLVLLELFFIVGFLGVDRCFMGQICLGVLKGITLGGFGIWATLDWVAVLINALGSWENITVLGFRAHFFAHTVQPAKVAAAVGVFLFSLQCVGACGYVAKRGSRSEDEGPKKAVGFKHQEEVAAGA